jgi:membrane-bound ClpP family serine protease
MAGKEVKVIKWQFTYGIVFFNGEIWKATSNSNLLPGDKAIIDKIDGLLLTVMSINKA